MFTKYKIKQLVIEAAHRLIFKGPRMRALTAARHVMGGGRMEGRSFALKTDRVRMKDVESDSLPAEAAENDGDGIC